MAKMCGPGFKPKGVGRKKWKKRWAQKKFPKPKSHLHTRPEARRVPRVCGAGCATGEGFSHGDGEWTNGGAGVVGSSLERPEDAGGSVLVLSPPFSGVSVPVSSSIGTYADSLPQPDLISGSDLVVVLSVAGLVPAKGSGVVGSSPTKPEDASGSVFRRAASFFWSTYSGYLFSSARAGFWVRSCR
jgi:hypothetical protein